MSRHEFRAKLRDLFPPNHPASAWLLRLMVIRDDLEYEFRSLGLKPEDGPEEVWRCNYAIRRIAISIFEARGILEQEVGKAANRAADPAMKLLSPSLRDVTDVVRRSAEVVTPIRNALGAHLRPQYADPKVSDVARQVLENHPMLEGTIALDSHDLSRTSYRALTSAALAFAWPHASDNDGIERCMTELSQAVLGAVPKILTAIDAILAHHWIVLGVLKPPEGCDFAVRDHKTGEMVRLVLKAEDGTAQRSDGVEATEPTPTE